MLNVYLRVGRVLAQTDQIHLAHTSQWLQDGRVVVIVVVATAVIVVSIADGC